LPLRERKISYCSVFQSRLITWCIPVLGGGGRDPHRSVTAVNTLHLYKSTLLVVLIGETNKAIATALTRHGIGHDLGRLARGEASLEERNQDILVDLRSEIAHEDAVFGATVISVVFRH
jgi:hypothetical protein